MFAQSLCFITQTTYSYLGRVTFPQWAVDRAMEMANEFLAREARYPTKLGNRLNVATDATGRQLFLTGEVSCMLLYKVFESAVPPYTSNGNSIWPVIQGWCNPIASRLENHSHYEDERQLIGGDH